MDTNIKKEGSMKRIILTFLVFVALFLTTGCPIPFEDLRDGFFYVEKHFDFSPKKDTFKIGDTLWLRYTIPKRITNEDFDVTFEGDSLECFIDIQLSKLNDIPDTTFTTVAFVDSEYDLFFRKGSSIPNKPIFYFKWDEECQKYVNEFGFLLQDTGKMVIRGNGYENYFGLDIEKRINEKYNSIFPRFYSTFESTGKGWFQFEVVE